MALRWRFSVDLNFYTPVMSIGSLLLLTFPFLTSQVPTATQFTGERVEGHLHFLWVLAYSFHAALSGFHSRNFMNELDPTNKQITAKRNEKADLQLAREAAVRSKALAKSALSVVSDAVKPKKHRKGRKLRFIASSR